MVTEEYIPGVEGFYTVTSSSAAYSTILGVAREGVVYDVILSGTPGSMQVLYNNTGTFTFSIAFSNPNPANDVAAEIVYILYKN